MELRTRTLKDAQHAGVERAGEHALDVGHDRAARGDHGFDGARDDVRGADAGTGDGWPNPAGQRRQDGVDDDDRASDPGDAAKAIPALDFRGQGAIHAAAQSRSMPPRVSHGNDLRAE